MSVSETLDARGKRCPMPVLMAKRAMAELCAGDQLEIRVTDARAPLDFETFARLGGHRIRCERRHDEVVITLTVFAEGTGEVE